MQAMRPDLCRGRDRLGHCGLPDVHGADVIHRFNGSLSQPALMGSDARAPREALMEDKAADKTAGVVAVVAGLVAAVKPARVGSREIQNRSPRVRFIISKSITIARMVVEASKAKE
jgi:hypothetical protein